jgi:demethylmenaquinone methyltransferase/2-methoxy-6-polyprenyl-1,4-benzoquinol methylase
VVHFIFEAKMTQSATPSSAPQVPHEPLTDYYADEDGRAAFVREMFDSTAEDYDRMEHILGLGTGPWYRGQALERAGLRPGMRVVDVGVGTGLVATQAARICGSPDLVVGIDPSPGMMNNARVPKGITLIEGRAEEIPFPDGDFDFLSMGYALRHIGDLNRAFVEFHRVIKPGGKLCLLEITCPESRWGRFLLKIYMKGVIPMLALIVGRKANTRKLWRYYWDTIEACVPPSKIVDALAAAGFTHVRRHIEVKGMSILAEYQATKPA